MNYHRPALSPECRTIGIQVIMQDYRNSPALSPEQITNSSHLELNVRLDHPVRERFGPKTSPCQPCNEVGLIGEVVVMGV